ncbi:putative ABC transport system permease protein [Desulfofundulus luciae]|uniref:ABC transport system permease protein n=1 Tax=Desulfofundulus luciae TaxID=74702 RepID=A0ABU0B0H5_9FIRM|nr:ABC transporter permease [Desulfofundulus luciae]MDQ0286231.1 putative ABC transport system permease protein [Desulfofundulus luciae]
MRLDDLIHFAAGNLAAYRLRAALTISGIAIGIAAVIAVVAIGQGGRAVLVAELEKLGSTRAFEITVDHMRGEMATVGTFRLQDAVLIKEVSPYVEKMAPLTFSQMIDVRRPYSGTKPVLSQLIGTTADFTAVRNIPLQKGRFISPADVTGRQGVVVLDAALAEDLFPDTDPLGKQVFIKNIPATVVGILERESSLFMGMMNIRSAYVPITFAQEILNSQVIHQLAGVAVSREAVPQAIEDSLKVLKARHPGSGVHYTGLSVEEQLAAAGKVTSVMTLIIGAVAGIALLVGGIGVMNIMLVAVTERTREIGLLMALGARRRDILQLFLTEAVTLCLVGSIFGVLLGAGGALAIAHFAHWPPLISLWTVLLAFSFAAAVGLFFGLYPASRAASLSPAEALRHL